MPIEMHRSNHRGTVAPSTLLILGGGTMQLPLIRAARAQGCRVVVSDANPEAPGRALAHHFWEIDLRDHHKLYRAARDYGRRHVPLSGVITAGTDFSLAVAYIANRLRLAGIPKAAARNATDKYRMRQILQRAGLLVPRFCTVRHNQKVIRGLRYPLVVKPVDNMGGRGTRRIESTLQLQEALEEAVAYSRSRRAIVEEFIEGREYSLDALIDGTNFIPCGLADRHINFPPYFVELGHTLPAQLSPDLTQQLWDCLRRAAYALGINRGAAKGDLFLTTEGVVVGEVAARLSGGYMSGWSYPLASGVHPVEGAIAIALNRHPALPTASQRNIVGERAIISIPGQVAAIEGVAALSQLPGVAHYFLKVKVGDRVDFPRNNVEKCANLIVQAPDRAILAQRLARALFTLKLRLMAAHRATYRFLYELDSAPYAYEIADSRMVHELRQMVNQTYHAQPTDISQLTLQFPSSYRQVAQRRDWHLCSLDTTLKTLIEEYGLNKGPKDNIGKLPPAFWRAIIKGGLQGGRFFFDTLTCGNSAMIEQLWRWRGTLV